MNRTVLITGASRGIGAACAKRFGTAGYKVIVHYHTQKHLAEEVISQILSGGGEAMALACNVADKASVAEMIHKAEAAFGGIDVLVNNAGIALYKMFCDTSEEDWDRIFAVNVKGMMNTTQAVLPHMIHQKKGAIVNLSSMWGISGASCEVAYSASKAAVIGFTKALAKELGPSGILVNCVAPGVIETDMNACLDKESRCALIEETPLGKIGSPEDVAEAVFFLASDQNRFTTGQVLSPNGGLVI